MVGIENWGLLGQSVLALSSKCDREANLVVGDDCPELSVFRWYSSVVWGGGGWVCNFPCLPAFAKHFGPPS